MLRRKILRKSASYRSIAEVWKILSENYRNYSAEGDVISPSMLYGLAHMRCNRINKGLAFTIEERKALGIHGLLPAVCRTQDEQLKIIKMDLDSYTDPLEKYKHIMELHNENEKLFFRLMNDNMAEFLPILYTPTVGLACANFGLNYNRPRGIFISINDKGHIFDILKNWPEPNVRAVCMTDGQRILGLGDLGAHGSPIPYSKVILYTLLAGIKPHRLLPITLDVGTDNKQLLKDPFYLGVRKKRASGPEYFEFLDELMHAIVRRYGRNTLIHFEDFGNSNAFHFLEKYAESHCTYNGDIQGTAGAILAGLICSKRITKVKKLSDYKYVFLGAGMVGTGIAQLCLRAMMKEGTCKEEAVSKITLFDIDGLVVKCRKNVTKQQAIFAKDEPPCNNFLEVLTRVKPSVLIGNSRKPGSFTKEVLKVMSSFSEKPLIFALSSPNMKAECTSKEAYEATDSRCIYSSGSPFPSYKTSGGKLLLPGQANNAYVYPGVALGVLACGSVLIDDEMFLLAAETLSRFVSEDRLATNTLYPPQNMMKDCSLAIAKCMVKYCYDAKIATRLPPPCEPICDAYFDRYDFRYSDEAQAKIFSWPQEEKNCDGKKLSEKNNKNQCDIRVNVLCKHI